MNPAAPIFATGTRVAGAVLIAGYVSGLVPGAVVSLVGGLALITFGRALLLDREGTLFAGTALAIAAGALGVPALRWGTLSLRELVGAQSVLGPSVAVGPTQVAVACAVALGAALVALAVWSIEPAAPDRRSRVWSRLEAVLGVFAAGVVFAAPGSGGSLSELFTEPADAAITAGVVVAGIAVVLLAPRVLASRRLRWILVSVAAVAVTSAAGVAAASL